MKREKKFIKFKKERVVLSDTLPYEVPVSFTNRHFYKFLLSHKFSIDIVREKLIIGKGGSTVVEAVSKLLFGIHSDCNFINSEVKWEKERIDTIPYQFKIVHKENDYRELSIVHPKNQLQLIEFYSRYKELILYYSSSSPFSIRRPHKIAKYTYFKDRLHLEKLAELSDELLEQNDYEYETLKTFFVYKKYSNIHKFFESYQYHRAEKKYNSMFKFDISKCFDSIYTHSISWALTDKENTKRFLQQSRKTFSFEFDELMQKMNYNETNGIVIGPEFSRIFAELILQKIDSNVHKHLFKNDSLVHKRDYEIFRYVDDYFVFFNNDKVKDLVIDAFRIHLKDFKLYFNESKTKQYSKPIITEITIAKNAIIDLLEKSFKYEVVLIDSVNAEGRVDIIKKGKISIDSNWCITSFKTVVFKSGVDYKDILNYSFAIVERKLSKIIKTYFEIQQEPNSQKDFVRALLESLDFVFFLFSASPRVNTTIRISRILNLIISTLKLKGVFTIDYKHLVFKKIHDNINFILQKNKSTDNAQIETLYLLITLSELGGKYWLSENKLAEYVHIETNHDRIYQTPDLHYFSYVVLLFYIKNKVRYSNLRAALFERILEKFESVPYEVRIKKTELTLLLFDILTYPYSDISALKRKLLSLYRIDDFELQTEIINFKRHWFTTWNDFKLGKELDAKQSLEVY